MSFLSMLQMARGKEAPPENRKTPNDQGAGSHNSSRTTNSGQRPANNSSKLGSDMKQSQSYKSSSSLSSHKPQDSEAARPSKVAPPARQPVRQPAAQLAAQSATQPATQPAKLPTKPQSVSQPHPRANNTATKSSVTAPAKPPVNPRGPNVSVTPRATTPAGESKTTKKKLSFKEMMKQAANIDRTKLEVNLKVANKPPPPQPRRSTRLQKANASPGTGSDSVSPVGPITHKREGLRLQSRPAQLPRSTSTESRSPAPFAQPSPELMQKIQQRRKAKAAMRGRAYDEDDEDLDDFVVSEEDEGEVDAPSDIWSMFNRRPRSYYSARDSDDDMEATGDDILSEERRSAAQARREDVEEERKLEELARKKKLRRNH